MTPENFVYWLQGYFEILSAGETPATLNAEQIKMIEQHLGYVFKKMEQQPLITSPLTVPLIQPQITQPIYPGLPGGAGSPWQGPLTPTPRPPWQPPYTVECSTGGAGVVPPGSTLTSELAKLTGASLVPGGKVEFC